MSHFTGEIVSGEFDHTNECFYLTQVKNLYTQSNISEKQLTNLYQYLMKQDDNCTLTINDQLPILLQVEEINDLLKDLKAIMNAKEWKGVN
ncbi:hypothetical protein D8M04_16850 [Oceanobacillus piezotolerans]|uniref:Uncharacterized protein n=1 Tax=Oceanobacillus piezotolerans TaxID=2448030 RepID=A0A498D7F9_9BACI|nr:hypothetical protein [Oceanobacillus piezotolerans]RLL41737.1 hypothetical protein D8M04_16850 [Oceanobacillus piezotolerans]